MFTLSCPCIMARASWLRCFLNKEAYTGRKKPLREADLANSISGMPFSVVCGQPALYWDIMPMITSLPCRPRAPKQVLNISPPTLSYMMFMPLGNSFFSTSCKATAEHGHKHRASASTLHDMACKSDSTCIRSYVAAVCVCKSLTNHQQADQTDHPNYQRCRQQGKARRVYIRCMLVHSSSTLACSLL